MSRLCRLKTKSHGEDGLWAYNEILLLRKQRDELLASINECYQMLLTEPMAKVAADRAEAMLREVLERK